MQSDNEEEGPTHRQQNNEEMGPTSTSTSSSSSTPTMVGQSLIPVVNKLQDICSQSGVPLSIDLPQVAVVGSQSSGKSSVIEALCGRDFLPRGPDVVTRRPLYLQLFQTNDNSGGGGSEYGEFLHLPGRKFYDFSLIRREIQAETEREAGANRGISEKPINLKIYSPHVLNMTLIDLPGITRVPVGDQPTDIEEQIRKMIKKYISKKNCLILAVSPANVDLANSDALKLAQDADPSGKRTIGVITKLDIMDRGTDARDLLLGKIIPLQLGYIGVVNRSQEDIKLNRSIQDALAAEEKFFRSHPAYISISGRCGVPKLAKKLNQILVQHIRECLPALKARISSQLIAVTKEYASYGEIPESRAGQGTLLLNILSTYSEAFSSLVEGKSEEISTCELSGGARIHHIFQFIFVKTLEGVDPCDGLSDLDIRTAIQNARGPRSAVFAPEVPFEVLVRRQIARLLDPSLQCARFVYNELVKMSHCCMVSELQRYPVLRKRIDEVVGKFLRENLNPAELIIGHIIEMEMDYINTSHPNFIGGTKALEVAQQHIRPPMAIVPKQRDGLETELVQGSERPLRPRGIISRPPANGVIESPPNGVVMDQGSRTNSHAETKRNRPPATGSWYSAIFSGYENHSLAKESPKNSDQHREPAHGIEHHSSIIHLQEPPAILRSSETPSEQEATEIAATKLLLSSYFDIVRKFIEDSVPKATMHFLVNNTKRELHNVLIQKLYRENLFEEMLQEPGEIAVKRKRARETQRVLQQAFQTLDELPLEAETSETGYSLGTDSVGLPKAQGLPPSSSYATIFHR